MNSNKTFRTNTLVFFLLILGTLSVHADDTEVYLGSNLTSQVQPNIVFIIDNSGSMRTADIEAPVVGGVTDFDPAVDYCATYGYCDCSNDRIYWNNGTTGSNGPPDCTSSSESDDYIDQTAFVCQYGQTILDTHGWYEAAGAARYIPPSYRSNGRLRSGTDSWRSLDDNDHSSIVECDSDRGVHGKSDTSTTLYPADTGDTSGTDPGYRADEDTRFTLAAEGGAYTFYSGNYINWRSATGASGSIVYQKRLDVVKQVFSNLMDSVSGINAAVMRFNSTDGGYFIMPMQALTDANRQAYKDAVNNLVPETYTPLSETLYEAYLFYKGSRIKYGANSVAAVKQTDNTAYYKSPLDYTCQKNFVILLTDGAPYSDGDADSDIRGLDGFSTVTGSATCSGNCMDELADYMSNKDCSTLTDKQTVNTYTIGFGDPAGIDETLMQATATKGGGEYYLARNASALTDAFTTIVTDILAVNTTFIAPAVSVNAFNRFTHRDELYYALFKPNTRPNWNGNIKRFKLDGDPPIIVDANNDPAIDNLTGFFKTDATSFWTLADDAPDGDRVEEGGAASKQTLPRTVYTYTGSTPPNNVDLTASAHLLHESNLAITKTMLGNPDMLDEERTEVLQWARGVDVLDQDTDGDMTDARRHMGDPLHSKPLLITYSGTDANPDMTLFAASNEGYLHAISTSNLSSPTTASGGGTEVFAFMPQELLDNLPRLLDNSSSTDHLYGLDGPLTAWVNDLNNNALLYDANGNLESTGGVNEHAYLYQGMRRGGRNYYALDVTDRSTPRLKWIIQGGTGDFSELAETWSAATRARIRLYNGSEYVSKTVLIFGGGYDAGTQDVEETIIDTAATAATATDDTSGRAIYMVDAETGAKIWQAGPAGTADTNGGDPQLVLASMTNSIPADVRVIDVDSDGYSDRLYVGDMRGRLWRFDIDNTNNSGANDLITGAIIAELGGSTGDANRRFFYAPDASLSTSGNYINIAIGSGYRAHPLNEYIHDGFFVIRDYDVYTPPADSNSDGNPDYTTVTISDLVNVTDNATTVPALSRGWYLWLQETAGDTNTFIGEKVLAKSVTVGGEVMFTTYTPVASVSGACSPSQGRALSYIVSVEDASPTVDLNQSGDTNGDGVIDETDLTRDDRSDELERGGIPPEVSILFNDKGVISLIGTEKGQDPKIEMKPKKIYWRQE